MQDIGRYGGGAGIGNPHSVETQPLLQFSEDGKMGQFVKHFQMPGNGLEIHHQGGPLFSYVERQAEYHFFKPGGIRHPDVHGRQVFFPYTGHRIAHGGRHLDHVVVHRLHVFDKIDHVSMGNMPHNGEKLLEDMAQR